MLAAYVSGHGFGHATRTGEVLRKVHESAPGLPITVSTSAPAELFAEAVGSAVSVRPLECDVGLVQKDALTIDEAASADAVARFLEGWPRLVETESRWLREAGARVVLGDIPPLAFAAAAEAGIHSIALANFSWDWIYRHLGARQPRLVEAAAWAAAAYGRAGVLLRLPFAGDLRAFPKIEDIPLVVRRPFMDKAEARRRLGLDDRPAVLLSFGGLGLPGLEPAALGRLHEYQVLLTSRVGEVSNLGRGESVALAAAGLDYPDLIGAADVVVSKPGYGIVTDCIGAGTRLVYTDRGDFPEYPILVSEMPRCLPVAYASNEAVRAGRLADALGQVMALPVPAPVPTNGASVAADRLLATLQVTGGATSAGRRSAP